MGPTKTTVENKTEPWEGAKPYLEDMYKQAEAAFKATNNKPFTGDFIAGPTGTQTQAWNQLKSLAPQMGSGWKQIQTLAKDTASGKYLDPATNPFLQATVDASLAPINKQLMETVLPGISDKAIAGGAYGGSRQDLQQNQAVDAWSRAAGDITAPILYENYGRERQNQLASGALFDQADNMRLSGSNALMALGDLEQVWKQMGLDNTYAKFQEKQSAPWSGIGEVINMLNAGGYSSGQQTQTTQPGMSSMLQGLMGGLSGGASLASGLGVGAGLTGTAALSALAPWAIPFGLLGGLAGGIG